jgi:hypothetical protein
LHRSLGNHSFSLLSIVIKVFLYPEWPLRSKAFLVSISLSFSSVYYIYPSATSHVSRSYLHMKRSRCIHTHKQSLQPTNHFWFSYTPCPSFFSFHRVQKKLHPLCRQFCPTTEPKSIASFTMIQLIKCFQCSPVNDPPCPPHHIWKSLQEESRCSQNVIHHDCCSVFVHILCTWLYSIVRSRWCTDHFTSCT